MKPVNLTGFTYYFQLQQMLDKMVFYHNSFCLFLQT